MFYNLVCTKCAKTIRKYSLQSGSISAVVSYGEICFLSKHLHSKASLSRESHLRVAQTGSHHIYHNNFQFVDFQNTDLHLRSSLLQYPVELGVGEAEEPISILHRKKIQSLVYINAGNNRGACRYLHLEKKPTNHYETEGILTMARHQMLLARRDTGRKDKDNYGERL